MNIGEVSEILGLCYFLKVPEHVFITDEKVSAHHNGVTFYRGLQPKSKGDSVFLSAQADETTPIHESIHAMTGFGEPATVLLTNIIMRKNRALKNFPMLAQRLRKKVSYKPVQASSEYPEAHKQKFKGRVKHYILMS